MNKTLAQLVNDYEQELFRSPSTRGLLESPTWLELRGRIAAMFSVPPKPAPEAAPAPKPAAAEVDPIL